jgi:hypothetical protein
MTSLAITPHNPDVAKMPQAVNDAIGSTINRQYNSLIGTVKSISGQAKREVTGSEARIGASEGSEGVGYVPDALVVTLRTELPGIAQAAANKAFFKGESLKLDLTFSKQSASPEAKVNNNENGAAAKTAAKGDR